MEPDTNYCSAWVERVKELEALLSRFVDDEKCYFDHYGYCQNHSGGCAHEGGCTAENCPGFDCVNAAARKALGLADTGTQSNSASV